MSDLSEKLGIATYGLQNGGVLIRLVGALDVAGSSRLMDKSARIDPAVDGSVALILEGVTFVDAAGIAALIDLGASVRDRGGQFVIAAPGPHVRARVERAGIGRSLASEEASRRADADAGLGGEGVLHQAQRTDVRC